MIKIYFVVLISLFTITGYSQILNSDRYKESIFANTSVEDNVQYGSAPQWIWPYWNQNLILNISQPSGDENTNRPLIIFAHAGGFINGSKDVDNMVALCDSFSRKGFVTATIDYRKGFDPLIGASAERAVYRGIQDGKTAVRYFKTNAELYNIDTNYVFFGGMSAGGFIALHVGYMNLESERPESTFGGFLVNDLGCLDCGDHQDVSSSVRGVLDFWGAMQDTSYIKTNGPPMQIMHGENDPTVPFNQGNPFGVSTVPAVFGGEVIKERCEELEIPFTFHTSSSDLHMLDGSNNGTWDPEPNAFWSDTIIPNTTTFIYELIKPQTEYISAQEFTICVGDSVFLEINNSPNSVYNWNYDPEQYNQIENNNPSLLHLNFPLSGDYLIEVLEYNEILCAGDTLEFHVIVNELPVADFTTNAISPTEIEFTNTSLFADQYLWDFGDGNISTEENPTHTYNTQGNYTVTLTVTSEFNCLDVETSTPVTVGIDEYYKNKIYIYPNPNTGEFYIDTRGLNNISITITSIEGKEIKQLENINSSITTIEIDKESGIYFVKIWNKDIYEIRKIVKQ